MHIATRVMILTAVKEMNGKKGVSILSIYKYVSSIYRYDVQRNRSLLKRMLKCLIFEGLVKQIKGHGFSGTFTLGKNYKEEDIYDKTKKQVTEHLSCSIWCLTEGVDRSHLTLRLLETDINRPGKSHMAVPYLFFLNISFIRVETIFY